MPPRKTLACVTMAYNEADMLPIWLRHHGRQVGPANCFVLDHGSDDGSTASIGGARLLRLARSPLDEVSRARFVAQFCNGLLQQYDYVAYTDADELLVADPARWPTLLDYVQDPHPPVTTAFGLNLVHRLHSEPACNPALPILAQRRWAFPTSSMCKPLLIRSMVSWQPGFHGSIYPPVFDHLFLFHLAFFDHDITLRRARKRRSQSFADANSGIHHRTQDDTIRSWLHGWANAPQDGSITLTANCPATAAFMAEFHTSASRDPHGMFHVNLHLKGTTVWRIPERFAGSF